MCYFANHVSPSSQLCIKTRSMQKTVNSHSISIQIQKTVNSWHIWSLFSPFLLDCMKVKCRHCHSPASNAQRTTSENKNVLLQEHGTYTTPMEINHGSKVIPRQPAFKCPPSVLKMAHTAGICKSRLGCRDLSQWQPSGCSLDLVIGESAPLCCFFVLFIYFLFDRQS